MTHFNSIDRNGLKIRISMGNCIMVRYFDKDENYTHREYI